jgi:Amt family ammonium transporter
MSEITPVVEWPDYATDPNGGDPFTQDLNAPYDKVSLRIAGPRIHILNITKGDLCWLLVCTILCW